MDHKGSLEGLSLGFGLLYLRMIAWIRSVILNVRYLERRESILARCWMDREDTTNIDPPAAGA